MITFLVSYRFLREWINVGLGGIIVRSIIRVRLLVRSGGIAQRCVRLAADPFAVLRNAASCVSSRRWRGVSCPQMWTPGVVAPWSDCRLLSLSGSLSLLTRGYCLASGNWIAGARLQTLRAALLCELTLLGSEHC